MASRRVKTPMQTRKEQQEKKERDQRMTIKITAMTKTVKHVNTRRAWTQWMRHTKKPVKSAHEAIENSSAQEIKGHRKLQQS